MGLEAKIELFRRENFENHQGCYHICTKDSYKLLKSVGWKTFSNHGSEKNGIYIFTNLKLKHTIVRECFIPDPVLLQVNPDSLKQVVYGKEILPDYVGEPWSIYSYYWIVNELLWNDFKFMEQLH